MTAMSERNDNFQAGLDALTAAADVLPCLSVLPSLLASLQDELVKLVKDVRALEHERVGAPAAAQQPFTLVEGIQAEKTLCAEGNATSESVNAFSAWQHAMASHGFGSECVEGRGDEKTAPLLNGYTQSIHAANLEDAESHEESQLCVRYFYVGQKAGQGRVLVLQSRSHSWDVPAGYVREQLRKAGINLKRFAAYYYSEEWRGFRALPQNHEELLQAAPFDGSNKRGCVDVQLEEHPGLTEMALRSLRLDAPPGFFGIGIIRGKTLTNHGLLWRSALQLGAAFTCTIGARYVPRLDGMSDRYHCAGNCPQWTFDDFAEFAGQAPFGASLVAVEMGGRPLDGFEHPERCVYLLGSEDGGLPSTVLQACHAVVSIPSLRASSFNVAVAGSIVMYDRLAKERSKQLRHSMQLHPRVQSDTAAVERRD